MRSLSHRIVFFSIFIILAHLPALASAAVGIVNLDCVADGGTTCPSGAGTISSALPPVLSAITMPPGTCPNVLDVNVSVDITHTDAIEYAISVSHNGVVVGLYDADCDGEEDMNVIFDESGGNMVCATPITGTYKPNMFLPGSLADFNGGSGDGSWELSVTGDSTRDVGELNDWGISVTCSTPPLMMVETPIPALSLWGIFILLSAFVLMAWLVILANKKRAEQ